MISIDLLQSKLGQWYDISGRQLPFRSEPSAYKVWLSEIIMQQTQMKQGVPYYLRFLERFPNVHALAEAKEDLIMKLWQGLGYYNRARNMHHTAKHISKERNGRFPTSYEELLKLKGIGPYTAAAIASIAYGKAVAVVDGNVERVISRLFAVEEAVNSSEGKKIISHLAKAILDSDQAGRHNQAMMDLGSTVCTVQKPLCHECPIAEFCKARQLDLQHELPVKLKKKRPAPWFLLFFDLQYEEHRLMIKRPNEGIWPSLHEPPSIELNSKPAENVFRTHWDILQEKFLFSAEIKLIKPVVQLSHQLTHKNILAYFQPFVISDLRLDEHSPLMASTETEIEQKYGITRLYHKYLEKTQEPKNPQMF